VADLDHQPAKAWRYQPKAQIPGQPESTYLPEVASADRMIETERGWTLHR
jgi:hypothetical protein